MTRKARGYSALEMVVTASVVMVAAGAAAPNIIKTNRVYKLQSAAQQISQALENAKFDAIRTNTSQSVIFNTANNSFTVNGKNYNLPAGVTFDTLPTSMVPPGSVVKAVDNKSAIGAGQCDNDKAAVSFPTAPGNNVNTKAAVFNTKGLPNVDPGTMNWVYLRNADGERIAITLSSAGSTKRYQANGDKWIGKSDSNSNDDDNYKSNKVVTSTGSSSGSGSSGSNSGSGSSTTGTCNWGHTGCTVNH